MNPVAGSLTTTANAARENSIKGPGKGGGERNIVSLLIAYFNRANVTTLFPFARISRLHRSTSSPTSVVHSYFQSCNSIRVSVQRGPNPLRIDRLSIDPSSLVKSHIYKDIFHFFLPKFSNSKHLLPETKFFRINVWYINWNISAWSYTLDWKEGIFPIYIRLERGEGGEKEEIRSKFRYTGGTLLHHRGGTWKIRVPTVRGEKSIKIHLVGASFGGPLPTPPPFFSK